MRMNSNGSSCFFRQIPAMSIAQLNLQPRSFVLPKIPQAPSKLNEASTSYDCSEQISVQYSSSGNNVSGLNENEPLSTDDWNTYKLNCSYCGKYFRWPKDMRRHLRIHTGERPFSCNFCSYRAIQNGALVRHIRAMHKMNESESNSTNINNWYAIFPFLT